MCFTSLWKASSFLISINSGSYKYFFKKRQRQEIDRMKRRKRREMIKSDIKRQQKERAKERQRQKGMDV